ncbi:hypothetical protein IW262DRAFT_855420 [Armillaria fumosa]|nr:hypothetical protein IW262DRAFT_855420 [Armillaria fumosa]
MHGTTNFCRTRMLVIKIIRPTIETGSATGLVWFWYRRKVPIRNGRYLICTIRGYRSINTAYFYLLLALLSFLLFIAFHYQYFYITPVLLMPKLYANPVYVVLISRFQIIGGQDTHLPPTDMSFTTAMIRDITYQIGEGARPCGRGSARTGTSGRNIQ